MIFGLCLGLCETYFDFELFCILLSWLPLNETSFAKKIPYFRQVQDNMRGFKLHPIKKVSIFSDNLVTESGYLFCIDLELSMCSQCRKMQDLGYFQTVGVTMMSNDVITVTF